MSDFSNWVEKHEDVSSAQAIGGFVFIMSCMYGIYRLSTGLAARSTPEFTRREVPGMNQSMPTYKPATEDDTE